MGSVAALLSVRAGYETAIAAALGEAADAVAVTHTDAALQAVGHLKQHDLGRAGMLARRRARRRLLDVAGAAVRRVVRRRCRRLP